MLKDELESFINDFYDTISFESLSTAKTHLLEDFFLSNAVLGQFKDQTYRFQTFSEYLADFTTAMSDYPEIFSHGFHEKSLGFEFLSSEHIVSIKSKYEKKYNNGQWQISIGYNYFTLVKIKSSYKIATVLWEEEKR